MHDPRQVCSRRRSGLVSNAIDEIIATGKDGTLSMECGSVFEVAAIGSVQTTDLHARRTDPQTCPSNRCR
jgi:hypothetical protein